MGRARDIANVLSGSTALATDAEVATNFIAKVDGYALRETVYFTSSGSFIKSNYPWLRAMRIKVIGGGASGGGTGTTSTGQCGASPGGGAGGYAERFFTNISSLDNTVTVTVGSGGAAGVGYNTTNNGGVSEFGGAGNAWRTRATGGTGAGGNLGPSTSRPGGPGGVGTDGDLLVKGGAGGPMISFVATDFNSYSGAGGNSVLGGGGEGRTAANNSGADGIAGSIPGGGGSGGFNLGTNATQRSGGAGGSGMVILELFA
jgi:hypothetical protein